MKRISKPKYTNHYIKHSKICHSTFCQFSDLRWKKIKKRLAQCSASYFGDPGKFSMFFFRSFLGKYSQARNLEKKITEKILGPGNLMLNIPLLSLHISSPALIVGLCQGDCRKEPRKDHLCTKTKINQNSQP